tara:strand:+ start:5866 stop:6222 length:357 start_codon:yes stop_codon:yes gene_type:complete
MAINIITGFNSSSRESLDKRSGPYATLVDAKAALDTNERYVGLRVLIADGATPDSSGNFIDGDLTEYVFSGGIDDNDLIDPIATKPSSADYDNIVQLTQTAYNALGTPASTTLYIIVG